MLIPLQLRLKGDFQQLCPRASEFAAAFYRNLFENHPALRPLFEGVNMTSQGEMLIQALGLVINSLDRMEDLVPTLENLGYRHVEYGVKEEHYPAAIDSVIDTLQEFLGNDFTAEKEKDWRDALNLVTGTMIAGAEKVENLLNPRQDEAERDFSYLSAETDGYLSKFISHADPNDFGEDEGVVEEDLPRSFTVEFEGEQTVEATPLQTIYQIALQNGIPHIAECGAKAKCTTCRVAILEGLDHCLPRNLLERKMAELKGFEPEIRLSCQTRITGSAKLRRLVLDEEDALEASEGGIKSMGREVPLAVMFADIRGFTKIASRHLPYDIIHALNRYFRVVCDKIDENHGYIDKYIGDGLMVLFGLSPDREVHPCADAVRAAIGMQECMPELNEYLAAQLGMEFHIGIGIHFGPVVVGELGFPPKKQFTAIGDVVNVSSRIEGKCKEVNAGILISSSTLENLPGEEFDIRPGISVSLAGKDDQTMVYPVESETSS